jgi:ribosomal protein S1
MFNGCEYIIWSTFEGIVQFVNFYATIIDIGEEVGLLHMSEISHVCVTFMEALFVHGGKIKVSFL